MKNKAKVHAQKIVIFAVESNSRRVFFAGYGLLFIQLLGSKSQKEDPSVSCSRHCSGGVCYLFDEHTDGKILIAVQ